MLPYLNRSHIIWILIVFILSVTTFAKASQLQDKLYDDYGIDLFGFIEIRQGWRLQDDAYQESESISEVRIQLEIGKDVGWAIFQFKGDMKGDRVDNIAKGEIRELNAAFSPLDFMDIKMGRQTLTWGTGDLLFINDLFPKDWESFFIGRDDEYLKAPSDAIKISLFMDINLDFVWSPVFNGSTYIDGARISYWNPILGRIAGRDFVLDDHTRNSFFIDSEYAVRLTRTFGSIETALYGYKGFWKTPEGLNPYDMKLFYPRLSAYGASVRSPLFGGIGSMEAGYYDSREDRSGKDPFVRNSEIRFLAGFEREIAREFTGAIQYYLEWISDYNDYENSLQGGAKRDEFRHLVTMRLTKLLMNQNLRLSLFTYYSPSDKDAYVRPKVHYKVTDTWAIEAGGNIFLGSDDHTFFGQFQDATNVFLSVRWRL